LQVLKALHGIGADLGDPLHVSLTNGRVLVAGTGVSPERQRQIQAALETLPLAKVEFSDVAAAQAPSDGGQTAVVPETPGPYQARLEAQLGGRAATDRFAGEVLNWNETLMAHAYALHALALRFTDDASLDENSRGLLRGMALDHVNAMESPAANFDRAMAPALVALGAAAPPRSGTSGQTWQASSEQLFQAARKVEMLSSKLLGVARGEQANLNLPSELLGAVKDLRADLEQNHRLLGR
jgi:hypothetical protein